MKTDQWVLIDVLPDGSLAPHSRFDRERILKRVQRVKADRNGNKQVRAALAQVRSLPQLRLYWPWLRKIIENSPHLVSERALHNMLLLGCGVVETMIDMDGNTLVIPSSISFDAMSQEEFDRYFERAQQIVSEKILPGVNLKSLMNEARAECSFSEAA